MSSRSHWASLRQQVAGLGYSFGQVLPARAGAEDPEDPLEAGAVIGGGTAALGTGLPLRQVGLDESPLGIGQALHPKL